MGAETEEEAVADAGVRVGAEKKVVAELEVVWILCWLVDLTL